MDLSLPSADSAPKRPWWCHPALGLALMAVAVVVVGAVRWRLREIPLERDEGEYAYMGRLILEGGAPYGEAANMKWPGTWLAYAAIMAVCGQTTAGIHTGLLLVSLATSALVFVLGRRLCGMVGGAVAAGVYAVLAIGTPTMGLAAHATHFVMLCVLGGFVVLLRSERPGVARAAAAGVLFGLAGVMKQTGALFGLLAFGWLLVREVEEWRHSRDWRGALLRLGALGLGGLLPLAAAGLWIWRSGTWSAFWWWTVIYAKAYAALMPPAEGLAAGWERLRALLRVAPVLWGAAGAGLLGLAFLRRAQGWRGWLLAFAVVSAAAVCPGWYFREHYFLLLLPALALLAGAATAEAAARLDRHWPRWPVALLPVVLVAGGAAHALWLERDVFFQFTPAQACRRAYGINPFPESMEIARFLREHTAPEARLAILGSEPQILFYAGRRSATPFLYVYPLMEPQPYAAAMQREFAQQIVAADPDYLVMVGIDASWLRYPESNNGIFEWFARYQRQYHLVGLVDIYPDRPGEFRWFDSSSQATPRTRWWIVVLRNNRLAPR